MPCVTVVNKAVYITLFFGRNTLKFSRFYTLVLIPIFFSSVGIFGTVQVAQSCSWSDPFSCVSPTPPVYDPSQSDGAKQERIDSQAKKEADAILAEKRAKRKVENDAINKANAETIARQEAEEIAIREAADNIKRQEAEEKLANQQRDEKERNDKEKQLDDERNSALIKAGGNLFKAIFNVK